MSQPCGTQPFRHAEQGRIDRGTVLRFRFDGTEYPGHPGDTLASALLANGVRRIGTSVRLGRPRGIMSAGSEEPTGVVQLEAPFPDPMRPATMVELHDGLAAGSLSGRGRLADRPDPARYDAVHAHCDVLVVGAGPAGLAAASLAVASGARVVLADERPEVGGGSPGTGVDGRWDPAGARVLTRTTVFGYYDDNYLVAVERRTDHLGAAAPVDAARERIWRIRAGQVVLATGAHERPIAFAGNDLPGVMLAGSARTYLYRYGVLVGRRAVVFTTNDSGYQVAADLAAAGVEIAALVDPRPAIGGPAGGLSTGQYSGHVVVAAHGGDTLSTVDIEPIGGGPAIRVDADALLVSGGWSPVLHLYSQAGGRLRYDEAIGAFLPDGCRQAVTVAGAARGLLSPAACLADGADAARQALTALGIAPADWSPGLTATAEGPRLVGASSPAEKSERPGADLRFVPAEDYSTHFVDFQRDVTVADVLRATGAGLRSVEHVKRYTTAGTAHDQGKTSGLLTSAVVGQALDAGIAELGHTTFRPPYTPVSFAALAGRDRGRLYDPVRVTAIHDWQVRHGARFENVGQWKRAWYYPAEGEDLAEAVRRECVAARTGVAFMDASTLGKIEVQGPDAARFLDRLYTNVMSTLAVGAIRYGVMCGLDGMVFDDGTVARLAPDRFLLTTTTGNAGPVLDWMEEWLQTEWTDLAAWCTSVTDQWATVAVVGPRSRDVLARLAPGLAVDAASFPFMTWRDTVVTRLATSLPTAASAAKVAGLPARVCRISFSGELAYEVNVAWWHGLALWEAVYEAGAPYGITPYGTETMHVLRAEKGYPIVGQDTDGTVTPQDLGMAWVVSKKKVDFIGKRSFARPDTARPDRKQLVGLLPEDRALLLPEGVHVVDPACLAGGRLPDPPVPMLGHVTSSYRSAALGRTFALGLVAGGRDRIGHRLYAPLEDGRLVPVTVAAPVLYDPEGARRDGGPEEARRDGDPEGARRDGDPEGARRDGGPEGARHDGGPEEARRDGGPEGARRDGGPEGARRMAESLEETIRSPLAGWAPHPLTGVRLAELPFRTQVNLRLPAKGPAADAVGLELGVPLPVEPGTTAGSGELSVLWLGPDEWLVVGPPGADLAARLAARRGAGVSVVDTSSLRTTVLVAGPRARDLLAHGCALDLHPTRFPTGRCAQTLLAHAQIVLVAVDDGTSGAEPAYHVLVRSSFANHLADWLEDAAVEYR